MTDRSVLGQLTSFLPGFRPVEGGQLKEMANFIFSTQTGIIASTTSTQAGATPLLAAINVVQTSTGSGTDAVVLMPAIIGAEQWVENRTANTIKVFANGTDRIIPSNSPTPNSSSAGVSVASGELAEFQCGTSGIYKQGNLPGSVAAAPGILVESGSAVKISAMSAAGALSGTELVDVVQSGVNKRSTAQGIANLAPITRAVLVESGSSVKISAMSAASTLTGAELVDVVQGGVNKKSTAQDIADLSNLTAEAIATGASPVSADNTVKVTRITTGGTAGVEVLYLPDFTTTDPDGYTHVIDNGTVHVFVLDHQTDENDEVHISPTNGGVSYNCTAIDAIGNQLVDISAIVLDQESARINFIWWDWKWFLIDATDGTSTSYTNKRFPVSVNAMNGLGALPAQSSFDLRNAYIWVKSNTDGEIYKATLDVLLSCGFISSLTDLDLRAAQATGSAAGSNASMTGGTGSNTGAGGTALLRGGYSGAGAAADGGSATLLGGDSFATDGDGGDAILQPGAGSGTGREGYLILQTTAVPSAANSPGIAGAVAYDSNYEYRCIATNTWKRVALATWP